MFNTHLNDLSCSAKVVVVCLVTSTSPFFTDLVVKEDDLQLRGDVCSKIADTGET